MNLRLLLVLTVLSLPGCGTLSVKDDSSASDLDAMESNLRRHLAPRTLPNGELYCAELATTEDEQDACIGDLEDVLFSSEGDKSRGLSVGLSAIDRLRLARSPCGFFARMFRRPRCQLEKPP